METRRRRTRRDGGGFIRAFILLSVFCAILYLVFGMGLGKKIRENFSVSLLDKMLGRSEPTPLPTVLPTACPTLDPTAPPTAAPTGETVEVSLPETDIYMLQMGVYSDMESAVAPAQAMKAMGAAGYIMNDNGSYRLIAAAYSDGESAESVRKRLSDEGFGCTVVHLNCSSVDLIITASEERLAPVRSAFSLASELITQLDELAVDFDAESRTVEQGLILLGELRSNAANAALGISDMAGQNELLSYVSVYYADILNLMSEASASSEGRTAFSSALKALRIKAALRYVALSQLIGG